MEQKWYTKLLWWFCDLIRHPGAKGWIYNGYYHRDCNICKRIISEKITSRLKKPLSKYVTCVNNNLPNGLTLIQINPSAAVDLRKHSEYFGYLFLNAEGDWFPEYKLSSVEVELAYDLAADLKVQDCGEEL